MNSATQDSVTKADAFNPANDFDERYPSRKTLKLLQKYCGAKKLFEEITDQHMREYYLATVALIDEELEKDSIDPEKVSTIQANLMLVAANMPDAPEKHGIRRPQVQSGFKTSIIAAASCAMKLTVAGTLRKDFKRRRKPSPRIR